MQINWANFKTKQIYRPVFKNKTLFFCNNYLKDKYRIFKLTPKSKTSRKMREN